MERNPRPFDYDPAELGGPAVQPRHEFSRVAGHITLGESESRRRHMAPIRAPESVIDAALQRPEHPQETRKSEWLNYVVDTHTGEMVDRQQKGQAFVAETRAEQAAAGQTPQVPTMQASPGPAAIAPVFASPAPPAGTTHGYAAPGGGSVQASTFSSPRPVASSPVSATTPLSPSQTPASYGGYDTPTTPTAPAMQQSPARAVLPPAFSALQHPEPALPPGPHVDEQHLLEPPRHPVLRVIKSPWLWLGAGILMIFYFGLG